MFSRRTPSQQNARNYSQKPYWRTPKYSKTSPSQAKDFASWNQFKCSNLRHNQLALRRVGRSRNAFEACIISAFVKCKYHVNLTDAEINTDHAQLFFMSTLLWQIHPDTDHAISIRDNLLALFEMLPNYEFHRRGSSTYRHCVTNIYRTKDDRFFHLHGSINPKPSLGSLGFRGRSAPL